jgi:hypothetical protein
MSMPVKATFIINKVEFYKPGMVVLSLVDIKHENYNTVVLLDPDSVKQLNPVPGENIVLTIDRQ